MAVAPAELEDIATKLAQKIAFRLDQLVASRQRLKIGPLGKMEEYLHSQKGGPQRRLAPLGFGVVFAIASDLRLI